MQEGLNIAPTVTVILATLLRSEKPWLLCVISSGGG